MRWNEHFGEDGLPYVISEDGDRLYTRIVDYRHEDGTFSYYLQTKSLSDVEKEIPAIQKTAQVRGPISPESEESIGHGDGKEYLEYAISYLSSTGEERTIIIVAADYDDAARHLSSIKEKGNFEVSGTLAEIVDGSVPESAFISYFNSFVSLFGKNT